MIYLNESEEGISGDYIYDCPHCGEKRDVTTTGNIPSNGTVFVCASCGKPIVIIDREVKFIVAKAAVSAGAIKNRFVEK